jgi:outer membrane protein assembly factor BamD (BamD/ComL family)
MFIHVGNLYMKSNEFEKAIEAYEMYLKKYPNDPNAKELLEKAKLHVI